MVDQNGWGGGGNVPVAPPPPPTWFRYKNCAIPSTCAMTYPLKGNRKNGCYTHSQHAHGMNDELLCNITVKPANSNWPGLIVFSNDSLHFLKIKIFVIDNSPKLFTVVFNMVILFSGEFICMYVCAHFFFFFFGGGSKTLFLLFIPSHPTSTLLHHLPNFAPLLLTLTISISPSLFVSFFHPQVLIHSRSFIVYNSFNYPTFSSLTEL